MSKSKTEELQEDIKNLYTKGSEKGRAISHLETEIEKVKTELYGSHGQNGIKGALKEIQSQIKHLESQMTTLQISQLVFKRVIIALNSCVAAFIAVEFFINIFRG